MYIIMSQDFFYYHDLKYGTNTFFHINYRWKNNAYKNYYFLITSYYNVGRYYVPEPVSVNKTIKLSIGQYYTSHSE